MVRVGHKGLLVGLTKCNSQESGYLLLESEEFIYVHISIVLGGI